MSQIQTRQQKIASVRALLTQESVKAQLRMVAPRHLTPDRITRVAMTSIHRTPKLLDCTPESLLGSLLTCTQLGLEPDDAGGRAYLIPYADKATLIIGYRGLMELARRSGEIATLDAQVVHKNDVFEFEYGTNPFLRHKPMLEGDAGPVVAAYAVATTKARAVQFDVMSKADLEAIRGRSRAKNDGPWVTDTNEMYRKTVVRRLCKYLPSSPELSRAVSLDEQAELGIPQSIDMVEVEPRAKPKAETPKTLEDVMTAQVGIGIKQPDGSAEVVTPDGKVAAIPPPEPQQAGIGMKSELYKQIKQAFDQLKGTDRDAVRSQLGIRTLEDVAMQDEQTAVRSLGVIQDMLFEVRQAEDEQRNLPTRSG